MQSEILKHLRSTQREADDADNEMCNLAERVDILRTAAEYEGEDRVLSSKEIWAEATAKLGEQQEKFYTGLNGVDAIIDGYRPATLNVITAPTGQGKTTLLQTYTEYMAKAGIPCLWFTYENTNWELLAKYPEIPQFYLPRNYHQYSLDWLKARTIEAIGKYGIKVVFIDHLHYLLDMKMMALVHSLSLVIGENMRQLKTFTNDWNLCTFLVSHMKKADLDAAPSIEDIRDSSFIAQEADTVTAMWRHFSKKKDPVSGVTHREFTNEARVVVLKHRRPGGKLGLAYLAMSANNIFHDLASPARGDGWEGKDENPLWSATQ